MQSFIALRIKEALGIFRELITTTTTTTARAAFWDPPSGSKNNFNYDIQPVSTDQQSGILRGSVLACPADFVPLMNRKHYNTKPALNCAVNRSVS